MNLNGREFHLMAGRECKRVLVESPHCEGIYSQNIASVRNFSCAQAMVTLTTLISYITVAKRVAHKC